MNNQNELLASQRMLSMLESACEYSEQILDNIPSVFVVLNEENLVIRSNKAFCDLVGCPIERALHLDFTSFFTSENRKILLHHFGHLRMNGSNSAGTCVKLEIGGMSDNQPASRFFWRIFPLEHVSKAEGRVISIVGTDLSGLYQSELKLMNIFSSIPSGLMIVDCNGIISEVLSEYSHALLDKRILVGESLKSFFANNDLALNTALIQNFDALINCAGKSSDEFMELQAALGDLGLLKIGGNETPDKWIKPRFQPIVKNDKIDRYMVILEDVTSNFLSQQKMEHADMLSKQAQALYECATRDPLSGLYTRLFMNDSINRMVASAERGSSKLSIVMFDLDDFKSVNDRYGHSVGDLVIKEFSRIILQCTRETDVSVRYGGEEFILALPIEIQSEHNGLIVAERIRECLEQTLIAIGDDNTVRMTVSCGVSYHHNNDTLESLICRADRYLYDAKHYGKNRVCSEPITVISVPVPNEGIK